MFDGINAGQLEVKMIPRSSKQANLLIRNRTGQPLNVRLPQGFVGVPVLAQIGGLGGGGGGGGQGMGGGGMMGGMGGMGGGGMFSVPAERIAQVPVHCVCLEHGKPEPRPTMTYEVKPVSSFTSDTRVHQLLRIFSQGQLDQKTAQAAAWHLTDNMSWDELAAEAHRHIGGGREPFFTPGELSQAQATVQLVTRLASSDTEGSESPAGDGPLVSPSEEPFPTRRDDSR